MLFKSTEIASILNIRHESFMREIINYLSYEKHQDKNSKFNPNHTNIYDKTSGIYYLLEETIVGILCWSSSAKTNNILNFMLFHPELSKTEIIKQFIAVSKNPNYRMTHTV